MKLKNSEPNGMLEEAVSNLEKKMAAQEGIIDKLKMPNPKTIYVYCNMITGQNF